METWLIDILNEFGYIGIMFLIAFENIFPPIPSEVILTFSGFMTTKTQMMPIFVIISATIGSLGGAYILYYVGSIFNETRINTLLESRIGKLLGFKKESVHKTIIWFQHKGKYGTLFGRCIPVIRSLISLPAGMAQMPLTQFTIYTLVGSLIWNILLVSLGCIMGENWNQVVNLFNTYTNVMILFTFITLFIIILYLIDKRRK